MLYVLRKLIRRIPGAAIKLVKLPSPDLIESFGSSSLVGELIKSKGYSNVLLITDKTLFSLGLHQKIVKSLEENDIKYTIFDDISSEPNLKIVEEGKKILLKNNAEAIIALGGGAVMDSSKMIASAAKLKNKKVSSLLKKFLIVKKKTFPIFAIPTTAGTGAEFTVGAVITNNKGAKKCSVIVGLDVISVILDGELTINSPKSITAACGIDALSHGLEGVMSSTNSPQIDITKSMECVKLVLENLPILLTDPKNIDARQKMLRAAHYGGNAINKQLVGYVHSFAHTIGAKYHIPHGNAIAMSILPVTNFQKDKCIKKIAMLSRYCGYSNASDDECCACEKLLYEIENLIKLCNFSNNLIIKKEDYLSIAHGVALDSINYSAPIVLSNKDIYFILDKINN